MKFLFAKFFRFIFKFNFFKKKYFGIHKKIFKPNNIFKGLVFDVDHNGHKYRLHIEDWIQENLFFLREYEKAELIAMSDCLKEKSVFIDIGANFGIYSLYASKIISNQGKIIAFEPFSENYKKLEVNIQLNGLNQIQIEKMAVGDADSSTIIYYDKKERNLGMATLNPVEGAIKETVTIIKLDSYIKAQKIGRIDFIKIDIEGFEYAAIMGMKKTIQEHKPILLIEILDNLSSPSAEELLMELGYEKFYINNEGKMGKENTNRNRKNFIFKYTK
jgi:FkbM family methyltransferase